MTASTPADPPVDRIHAQVADLEQRALAARAHGHYGEAARLYGTAAALADNLTRKLNLMMRAAHSHAATDNRAAAEEIARTVAEEARAEFLYPDLADALSVLVDSQILGGDLVEATRLLAEAMYVMDLVADTPENYQVVHNMGDTYLSCHFPVPALELYERALALAEDDTQRTFTLASVAAAHHMALNFTTSAGVKREHAKKGLEAADAALDANVDSELMTRITALAHRSGLLNALERHEEALRDALEARCLADLHSLVSEEAIAMIGEVVARWRLYEDPTVIDLIGELIVNARGRGALPYCGEAAPISVELLWVQGRYDEARDVMNTQHTMLMKVLAREREARWEHVRLGVSYRTTAAMSESDPLTGLPNRRYLGHWLPEVLDEHGIVCVGVLDLDGFKQINDVFSYAHGDRVLQQLAGILQRTCRRGDAVVRLGGDEFVLVLRETSPGDARLVLERVRQLIGLTVWDGLPPNRRLTASVGVAVGGGASDAARVLSSASEALQTAKRGGRDRIVFR
jgi:diguanylate cyclase (GGDEF)-like protein